MFQKELCNKLLRAGSCAEFTADSVVRNRQYYRQSGVLAFFQAAWVAVLDVRDCLTVDWQWRAAMTCAAN
ncbi:MAG: hypothetical protein ACI8XU_001738 [Kiritimatiellia bacterium]|jgi:hypothetical protein